MINRVLYPRLTFENKYVHQRYSLDFNHKLKWTIVLVVILIVLEWPNKTFASYSRVSYHNSKLTSAFQAPS